MWYRATASLVLTIASPQFALPRGAAAERVAASPGVRGVSAARETLARFDSAFLENRGQAHPSVLFYENCPGGQLSLTRQGVVIALATSTPAPRESTPVERVALEFLGADPNVRPVGRRAADGTASVFRGGPADWKTGISRFAEVWYPGLWPGVDLVVRSGTDCPLKYEFVVAPGADPSRIRLAYRSAGSAEIAPSGDAEIGTAAGTLRERAPVSYQDAERGRVRVTSAFRKLGDAGGLEVGFELGSYDATRPLVIDPEVVFSGLLAGKGVENVSDVKVDAAGNIYLVGSTSSTPADGFPVLVGPGTIYRSEPLQNSDAFVAKINPDGSRLVYCGYIGGERFDYATGVAVDGQGNAYVCGTTYSNPTTEHFPAVVGPSLFLNGEGDDSRNPDPFVAKVSADGSTLAYCGYINAVLAEEGTAIAVDAQGNAYVAGSYTKDARPRMGDTPPFDKCREDSDQSNAFVVKVKPDGSGVIWQNWIIGNGVDGILGITVDSAGIPYVTGYTSSPSICYVTKGPKLTPGGGVDAFVGKMTADGKSFTYLGFIGGSADDYGTRIAVDSSGAAYVCGMTKSTESTFPVTVGPDLTHAGPAGTFDGFVAKVKPDGSGLAYCGFIGGSADESCTGVAVDSKGRAFVTGFTASADFPTVSAIDATFAGGGTVGDGFVAEVAADGKSLAFSSFLGGTGRDAATAIALDSQGRPVVVGMTESGDGSFPTTPGAFGTTPMGYADVFVTKLMVGPPGPPAPVIASVAKQGTKLVVTGSNFVTGAAVLVNGTAYKAKPNPAGSTTSLKSGKAGKVVKAGDAITVRNPDGSVSNAVSFAG